jgi:hypothetical protein
MVKQSSKGQVSLEYLMTYGIAIAIVVIAVAALYSMGVFKTNTASTPPCVSCFSDFASPNFNPTTGHIQMELKNGPADLSPMSCGPNCNITYNGVTNATIYSTIAANTGFVLEIGGSSTTGATVQLNYSKSGSLISTSRSQSISKDYFK